MRGQKDLITMKKGVNKIENQVLQKCQMTGFSAKRRGQYDQVGHKKGTQ